MNTCGCGTILRTCIKYKVVYNYILYPPVCVGAQGEHCRQSGIEKRLNCSAGVPQHHLVSDYIVSDYIVSDVCVYMYVSMYVCMYVCMHVYYLYVYVNIVFV
jgi:hypothetical protein